MNPAIEKMHEARRAKRDGEIWESVERVMQRESCKCGLRKGMTLDQLPSGAGCKSPDYVCSALDTYRRLLPSAPIPEQELLMQEPWRALESA